MEGAVLSRRLGKRLSLPTPRQGGLLGHYLWPMAQAARGRI